MEVTIVIITYNLDSRLFLLQIEAIRKFCKDDFVIEIIDNSSEPDKAEAIRYHAEILGLSYRKTNANSVNGSDSHQFAANLSYQMLKGNGSYFMFYLDHDCIPIKRFSVKDILGDDKVIAGLGQEKHGKVYFWQGCVIFARYRIEETLIDFSANEELGLDTGGNLYKVIDKYGKKNCVFFNEQYCENPYYHGKYNFYALINDGMFLHCVGASGWNEKGGNEERINSLINIIKEKVDAKLD